MNDDTSSLFNRNMPIEEGSILGRTYTYKLFK